MAQPWFEPAIAVKKRPQTHTFDRMANGTVVLVTLTVGMLFWRKAFLEVQEAIVCGAKKSRKVKSSSSAACFEFWIQAGIMVVQGFIMVVQGFITTWHIPARLSLFEFHLLSVTSRDPKFFQRKLGVVQRETLAIRTFMQISRWDLGNFWHSET